MLYATTTTVFGFYRGTLISRKGQKVQLENFPQNLTVFGRKYQWISSVHLPIYRFLLLDINSEKTYWSSSSVRNPAMPKTISLSTFRYTRYFVIQHNITLFKYRLHYILVGHNQQFPQGTRIYKQEVKSHSKTSVKTV